MLEIVSRWAIAAKLILKKYFDSGQIAETRI
jgi:hypothetical protein